MKILFDVNFLNAYNTFQNSTIKNKIKTLIEQNKIQFFFNDILLVEWLGIFDTKFKYLLTDYAKIFIDLKICSCFKQIHKILNAEIGVSQESDYFEEHKTIKRLQEMFQNLSKLPVLVNVKQIYSMLDRMRDYRKRWFLPQQADITSRKKFITMKKNKSLRLNLLHHNFNSFYNLPSVLDQRKNWIYKHFNDEQKTEVMPMIKIEKCLSNPQNFPYINTWVRTMWAFQYLYVAGDRRVDENDLFDSYQLIYATDLDHFLTEEKKLKLISQMVFQNINKTLNFKEFCQKLKIIV